MVGCGCHERSDQSHSSQGYTAQCGCHEILIALCHPRGVLCPDQDKCPGNQNFPVDDKRNVQRKRLNTNWRLKKLDPNECKVVMRTSPQRER